MTEVVKRGYASELRADQARETRRRIVGAAGELFVRDGYGPTTVDAIAAAAGVGRKTVFTSVGGKAECLKLAIDRALVDDDEPVPMMARDRIRTAMQLPDAREMLTDYADLYTATASRVNPLRLVVLQAVGLDDAIRELYETGERQRSVGMTNLAGHLDVRGGLRPELTVSDAAAVLCTYTDVHVHTRLVVDQGWPASRFVSWLGETLVSQLIRPDYVPGPLPQTERARELGVVVPDS